MICLRPAREDDLFFQLQLYATTRADELALSGWDAAQQAAFLQMQFDAQRRYYLDQFPAAEYSIIQRDGVDVGRHILDRSGPALLLIDLALLPAYCNHGIGTTLLQDLLAEATCVDKAVRLHVEAFNRAQRLYQRLGFVKIGEAGVYYELEWRPASAPMGERGEKSEPMTGHKA